MYTVVMIKGHSTIELTYDKNQTYGRCRGTGNYVVRREDRKHYRMRSMLPEYKRLKAEGYKFSYIC